MNKKTDQKTRIRNPTQTRARLLQATVDLVAEKGADALSLKEAARIANVSRGVAYQHFEDRDHLLREARAWLSDRLIESLEGERDPDSTEDRVYRSARLVLNNREASRLMLIDAMAGKELTPDQPLYKLLIASLEQFTASGNARPDIDLEMLPFILLGSIASLIMLSYQHNSDVDSLARRFTDEYARILREGIIAPRARAPAQPKTPKKRA
ncbi:TetR/AcrR family transcriptional regulator [Solimonas terrae]|uniref:TetR/AcrR family transcriptional regulator n=1 Tax=Solimonas terrae TaxID=1396819 RepID=A0A6M2BP09_9GAMM|nr:TetR/AcrR family transcriptional regulator [Solimonas terrae]NGY03951.1 TetR/AcrR family transcriptional regulator [Solimonas terrae]